MDGQDNELPPVEGPDDADQTFPVRADREAESLYTKSTEMSHVTLHQCARERTVTKMIRLLEAKPNLKNKLNEHDEEGQSPLHYAARYNRHAIVTVLVNAGADVNDKDNDGATPLHFAARYRQKQLNASDYDANRNYFEKLHERDHVTKWTVISYLADKGAEINVQDKYGSTPLHFAATRGSNEACDELTNLEGIGIEMEDHQKMRALHLAAAHKKEEIVEILVSKGAEVSCVDDNQRTPLHYACKEDAVGVAKLLIQEAEKRGKKDMVLKLVNDLDYQEKTPLHVAFENGCYEVAKLLIDNGATYKAPKTCHTTPLHLAAISGNIDILRLLTDNHVCLDALDCALMTPLHHAAAHNQSATVDFLLKREAKANELDKDGMSPLLVAAYNGHAEIIKTLHNRVGMDDVDKNGRNAIYLAAERNHLKAIQMLVKKGPRGLISEADHSENTPLHIASQNGFFECVKELVKEGAPMDATNEEEQTPLHLASKHGKTKVVIELVMNNGKLVIHEDEGKNTALHLAASYGHRKTALALVDAKANVAARNRALWTPLDCAAAKGNTDVVKVLLEAGGPLDNRDKNNKTPLLLACERGHVSVVNTLIERGANVAIKDRTGLNCLDLAIKQGHKEVALAIIDSPQWKKALQNETTDKKTGYRDTPMRKLIRHMPDVAAAAFEKCTKTHPNNSDDPNYEITFNYEFLDDAYENWRDEANRNDKLPSPYSTDSSVLKRNHPLMIMVEHHQAALLVHPLVKSLLQYKWAKFGRYVYYTNLAIYCVFLTFLTVYVMETTAPYMFTNVADTGDFCNDVRLHMTNGGISDKQPLIALVSKYVVMFLAVVGLVREVLQLRAAKLGYLILENAIELIAYFGSILLVMDFSRCQEDTGIRTSWQWQLGAVAVFLAWINLLLFIRKFGMFGIYIVMFTDILQTFLKFSIVFFLFVVAFSLAFFMLMQNMYAFRRPEFSLLKTSVMMIGEFDFDSIFYGMGSYDPSDSDEDIHKKKLYYSTMSYSLFCVFLVIMAILVSNLLVGLAVDDIKAVQEQAIPKILALKVKLVLDVESIIPQYFRHHCVAAAQKLKPNANPKHHDIIDSLTSDSDLSSGTITHALNPQMAEMQQLQANVARLRSETVELKSLLTAIRDRHEIGCANDESPPANRG